MIKYIISILICCALNAQAAFVSYAPDLHWNDQSQSWLGMVNSGAEAAEVTIVGYAADGGELGSLVITLAPGARYESSALALFDNSGIAWASVSSEVALQGYVRYKNANGSGISMAPLSEASGNEVWIAQANILDGTYQPSTSLVNVAGEEGSATSNPNFVVSEEEQTQTYGDEEEPEDFSARSVPEFGAAHQQVMLDYAQVFKKTEPIQWDRLTAGGAAGLAGTQRLTSETGQAAISLPRTPYREMVVGPMQPNTTQTWNKMVLINTYDGVLPVEVIAYYKYIGSGAFAIPNDPQSTFLYLEAGERMVLDINEPTQLDLPAKATFYRIVPHEGGLLGYQLFGTDNGRIGAIEAGTTPSASSVLPYTPAGQTEISLINTGDESTPGLVYGFNDDGVKVAWYRWEELRAGEKWVRTPEELFGDKASQVTWMMAKGWRGRLLAHAVINSANGIAALQAQPITGRGSLYLEDAEQFSLVEATRHRWTPYLISDPGYWTYHASFESIWGVEAPKPGQFFVEHAFDTASGFFYLGYEPFYSENIMTINSGENEQVALVSPPIEIPRYGDWHLSFRMRFHNPQSATFYSQYGLMWREEGSSEWHWFGIDGGLLLNPPLALRDCWVDIQWRNERTVTITPWFPMERALPSELRGKRIQVGYYYNHEPSDSGDIAPWMFIDQVEINPRATPHALFYENRGEGSFTVDEEAVRQMPESHLPHQ